MELDTTISTEPVEIIIGITETWVDTAGRDFGGEYRLPGFSLFLKDQAGRARGSLMPKHPLDANLALYESLSALVWEKTSVLAGDFNCSRVDWETDLAVEEGLRLLDLKHGNFLSPKVWEPDVHSMELH